MSSDLTELTQSQFDSAESAVIALIRAAYPTLDLRRGTVIRDVLIRPAATVYAQNTQQLEIARINSSLELLNGNPELATPDAINALLANFGVELYTGAYATGKVIITVGSARTYSISEGFTLQAGETLTYSTRTSYIAKVNPNLSAGEIQLYSTGTTYYMIIDVTADQLGEESNIVAGTKLIALSPFFDLVSSEVYSDFRSGVDAETIDEVLIRLPAAVSHRAFESRYSIASNLNDYLSGQDIPLNAVSVQGMGDPAQLRDKHNPMGFTVGSRVDVYLRTFDEPQITVVRKTGTRTGDGEYTVTINAADAPAFYAIRSISEVEDVLTPSLSFSTLPVLGSYAFTEVRAGSGLENTYHDIDPANAAIETACSIYQQSTVIVTGVPATDESHEFKFELYTAPGIVESQALVDSFEQRNLEADYIVRMPLLCLVGVNAKVYYNASSPIDIAAMQAAIQSYINTRSFVRYLTRSEISSILHNMGASRVDLGTSGMMLQGMIRNAAGEIVLLQGDSLDLSRVEDASKLLSSDTTVFASEINNIFLEPEAE